MKQTYAVIYENGPHNLSAYAPDLPGCASVGRTVEETRANMKEAITFHLDLMLRDGEPIPEPTTSLLEALALHEVGLQEIHDSLGEDLPEPAIAELLEVDPSPDSISRDYGHLFPEGQDTPQHADLSQQMIA